jgi:hypothetical protein
MINTQTSIHMGFEQTLKAGPIHDNTRRVCKRDT